MTKITRLTSPEVGLVIDMDDDTVASVSAGPNSQIAALARLHGWEKAIRIWAFAVVNGEVDAIIETDDGKVDEVDDLGVVFDVPANGEQGYVQ